MTPVGPRPSQTAKSPAVTVSLEQLAAHCVGVLSAAGLPSAAAELVADSLVDADARGITSHGVVRLRIYTERIRDGLVDVNAEPSVLSETPCSVHVDGRNAVGHLAARAGVDTAADKAEAGGVGVAGVRNSNHCGTMAYFVRRATDRGLIALASTNAPPTMAYYGGRTRAVGTNPLAIGIPRDGNPPIVMDMATSATARGKIIVAAKVGKEIPEGWAVDKQGRPTTDAEAALEGSVLPFAGPKGSGLAMMIDLLCGGLTGAVTGSLIGDMYGGEPRPQRVGHFFVVLNPEAWIGRDAFLAHVAEFVDTVHALPPADGYDGVLLPGEVEEQARAAAERDGLVIDGAVAGDLVALADEVGAVNALGTPA